MDKSIFWKKKKKNCLRNFEFPIKFDENLIAREGKVFTTNS